MPQFSDLTEAYAKECSAWRSAKPCMGFSVRSSHLPNAASANLSFGRRGEGGLRCGEAGVVGVVGEPQNICGVRGVKGERGMLMDSRVERDNRLRVRRRGLRMRREPLENSSFRSKRDERSGMQWTHGERQNR